MARPYKLGLRETTTEETRSRIINASRELILSKSFSFSIETVAKQAGVARMTVYYQFESKLGLMEAIFDDIAVRGEMNKMPSAFMEPEPLEALKKYIAIFGNFWTPDRLLLRKLYSLARLDPEFEPVLQARENRRRTGLNVLLQRINQKYNNIHLEKIPETIDILYALTSFETFDSIAGLTKTPRDIIKIITSLALHTINLDT